MTAETLDIKLTAGCSNTELFFGEIKWRSTFSMRRTSVNTDRAHCASDPFTLALGGRRKINMNFGIQTGNRSFFKGKSCYVNYKIKR